MVHLLHRLYGVDAPVSNVGFVQVKRYVYAVLIIACICTERSSSGDEIQ